MIEQVLDDLLAPVVVKTDNVCALFMSQNLLVGVWSQHADTVVKYYHTLYSLILLAESGLVKWCQVYAMPGFDSNIWVILLAKLCYLFSSIW